ncbi:MAG: hypothetical protein IJR29_11625 [Butyrivibrio sp.]|nr:hypothetical protein [Butyrivibrio sp.]
MNLRRALKTIRVQTFHVFVYPDTETCAVSDDAEQFDVSLDVYGRVPINLKYADCHVDSIEPLADDSCNLTVVKNWKKKKKKSRINDLELQLEEVRRLLETNTMIRTDAKSETVPEPDQEIFISRSHSR